MGGEKIKSFTDLHAWQEGHKLVLMVYKVTEEFPPTETYGLTNQMRRAAVSVTSNIAEGFSRKTEKNKRQFYSMSHSSLNELQNQLLIARDIGYVDGKTFSSIAEQTVVVGKLLGGLKKVKGING